MTFPMSCGRIDEHPAHDWTRPKHACGPTAICRPRTLHCLGHVIVAGAERVWDGQDDAAEDRADREKRETA